MALDQGAKHELRLLIAESRRRQEMYWQTIADSILLAAEQVQDKRIELVEKNFELSASGLLLDIFFNLGFSVAGVLIKKGMGYMFTKIVRQRMTALIAFPGRMVEPVKKLTPERIAKAANTSLDAYPVLPKEGPEPYRLLREFGEEGGKSAIVDTAKGAIKKTKARPALPSQELGGDSPGVALMDVVLSWRRAQIWQTQVTHDKQDLEVADDLYDETAAAALKVFYEKELGKKQSGGPAEVPDFAALKDQTKRFYEACIWAILFAARFWTGLVEKHERDRLLSWTTISQEEIPYPARQLQEYWISRFKLLPTFSKGNREDWVNLKFFLRELDQSIALVELIDAAAELLRIPKLKGAKVSLF